MMTRFDDAAILAILKEAIALLNHNKAPEVQNAQEALIIVVGALEMRQKDGRK